MKGWLALRKTVITIHRTATTRAQEIIQMFNRGQAGRRACRGGSCQKYSLTTCQWWLAGLVRFTPELNLFVSL